MIRKLITGLFGFWLLFMSYGLIISQYDFSPIQTKEQVSNNQTLTKYYDYKGITHAMSNKTRGSRSVEEIFNAAKTANLDFIFITDGNQFSDEDKSDLYSNGTRLFVAGKYSYVDSNILVYGGENIHKFKSIGQSQVLLNDLLTQKNRTPKSMSLVLAHPLRPKYTWSGEYPVGLDGIEVVNLKQIWRNKAEEERAHFITSLLLYPFNETLAFLNIISEPKKELKLWDELNKKRPTIGFLGNNTTAKAIIFPSDDGFIRFPSYKRSFSIASNHILLNSELTGMIQRDKTKILEALNRGQFYFSFDVIGDPKGFYMELVQGGEAYPLGSYVKYTEGSKMIVNLPFKFSYPFEIRLMKDGSLYTTSNQQRVEFELNGPGAYRVEIVAKPPMPIFQPHKYLPWIYTNHIYLTE